MGKQVITTLALLLGCARVLTAQVVHGAVVAAGEQPVSGVVVILVDAGAREVGRSLTNERGEYRLTAPRPGSYRLRTLRIGFQSVLTEPFPLVAGDDVTRRLAVSTTAFTLDTVRAVGKNPCKVVAGDSTSVVSAIWDQVRSALIATQLTLNTRTIYSTSISYQRMVDIRSQRIGGQSIDVKGEFATQPWRSLSADSLRKVGYIYTLSDSSRVYHAPDIAVLLSDVFLEDHCLRIDDGSTADRLGIEFSPTSARRNTPEIRGTIWLNRRTNELSDLEAGYINRITREEERIARVEVGFTRLRNGMWTISRWNIRMPVPMMAPVYSPTYALLRYEQRLDSMKVTGGELVMVTTTGSRRDTIWMRPPISLRGTVVDSLSGAPVRRAVVTLGGTIQVDTTDGDGKFTIAGVLPGRYSLNVTTPSLDSLNTVDQRSILFADSAMQVMVRVPNARMIAGSVCGQENTATRLGAGILLGSVVRADSSPVANASVAAQWNETLLSGAGANNRIREAQTRTDARGVFRICGLAVGTTFTVYAKTDSGEASPVRVELTREQRFARADLVLAFSKAKASTFTGIVVDTSGSPLADAEVEITDGGLRARSDAAGRFRIAGVLPGNHEIAVRRIGYGSMEVKLGFAAGETVDRRVVLTRMTVLDSVSVTARPYNDPSMDEFEERRRLGVGHFITRADIAGREGGLTSSLLQQLPGLKIDAGRAGDFPIGTGPRCDAAVAPPGGGGRSRPSGSVCQVYYVPSSAEAAMGLNVACYSKVYLDNSLMNPGTPTPPFNLRDVPPAMVEAIEYYARPAELPSRYNTLNSGCGVVIIHSRRAK